MYVTTCTLVSTLSIHRRAHAECSMSVVVLDLQQASMLAYDE